MKKKITKFYNDEFDTVNNSIVFSETSIFFNIDANVIYNGSFSIKSNGYKKVRGIIYTTHFRMTCKVQGFDAESVRIPYTFNSKGLQPGEMINGKFIIVSELGEYEIKFCASINTPYVDSSNGQITNLYEFNTLAMQDFNEAFRCFSSIKFRDVISKENNYIKNLYDGLVKIDMNKHTLEEFLIALNLKEPIQIKLLDEEKSYKDMEFSLTDSIDIIKDEWGYLPIRVEIEGDFIQSDIKEFSTLDFKENSYHYEYMLLADKLHEGKNSATISFVTYTYTKKINIIVYKKKEQNNIEHRQEYKEKKQLELELINNYIKYKTAFISVDEWLTEILRLVNELYKFDDNRELLLFIKAYAYLEAGRKNDAKFVLEEFQQDYWNDSSKEIFFGLYVYLVSVIKGDSSYNVNALSEIKRLCGKYEESSLLMWAFLQIDPYISQNVDSKYKMIETMWTKGHIHTILLVEALNCIEVQPSIMEGLSPFTLYVLSFAKKRKVISENTARYLGMIAINTSEFNPRVFEVLTCTYEMYPKKENLYEVCRYLITKRQVDNKFFKWYELGVKIGVHVASLYEYYMYSMAEDENIDIPINVYSYFSRDTDLDYKKKAFIYANIVKNEEKFLEIYSQIEKNIIKFTKEQLALSHINRSLAVLYDRYLDLWNLVREENNALADIYYTYELSTQEKNMVYVIVLHKGFVSAKRIKIIDGKALIKLYTKEDQILLQDRNGRIFVKTVEFKLDRLFSFKKYGDYIRQKCPKHIGILLSTCFSNTINEENISYYKNLLDADGISEATKLDIKKNLLWYYYKTENHVGLGQYISYINMAELDYNERSSYFGVLISEKKTRAAFEMIKEYGYEGIDDELLLEFCNRFFLGVNVTEHIALTDLCYYLFKKGYESENVFQYLNSVFTSGCSQMVEVWQGLVNKSINALKLEERILTQLLFCEEVVGESEIFNSYYEKCGNENIIKAYLSYKSFNYFVHNHCLENRFFSYILAEFKKGTKINTSWQLATLKYYSSKEKLSGEVQDMVQEFMKNCINDDFVFSFFRQFSDKKISNLSYSNRYIVQYQGRENSRINIYYSISKEGEEIPPFTKDIMPRYYYTYYSKEFILFEGEVLHYYITEEDENIRVVEVKNVSQKKRSDNMTGRFLAINKILSSKYPEVELEEYEKNSYLVNQLYQLQ